MEIQQQFCKRLSDIPKQIEVLPSSEPKICSKCCQGTQSLADNTYSLNNLSKRPPKYYQHINQTTLFRIAPPASNYLLQTEGCVFSLIRFFATPWTVPCQAPLPMEFSRQEYWSGLPRPCPGNLPDLGIEAVSPALKALSLLLSQGGSPCVYTYINN